MGSGKWQRYLATLLVGALAATGAWAQTIAYWEFEEKSPGNLASTAAGAIVDSSGNGRNLTAAGSPELPFYVEPCPAYDGGSSLNFLDPEDDRLFFPDSGGNDFDFGANESFTVEAVIGGFVQPDIGALVAKDPLDPEDAQWWFRHENGVLKFLVRDTLGNQKSVNAGGSAIAIVNNGAWHHVAAVRNVDAGVLQLYVNYILVAEEPDPTTGPIENDDDLTIGGFTNADDREFGPGDIDFVRISSGALTPAQFVQRRAENKDVLAFWDFEDGVVGTRVAGEIGAILDSGPAGRHATAVPNEPGDLATLPEYVEGVCGTALRLTAGDDGFFFPYSAPYVFDIPANEGMTFEIVAKTSALDVFQAFIARDDPGPQYWTRVRDDVRVQFFVSDGSGNSIDSRDRLLNDNRWHHVAFVRDGRAELLKLYIDYELVATNGEPTAGPIENTAPLTVGEFVTSSTRSFIGDIELVRISNGALTPAEFVACVDTTRASDLDDDNDTDLADFQIFQEQYSGPQ